MDMLFKIMSPIQVSLESMQTVSNLELAVLVERSNGVGGTRRRDDCRRSWLLQECVRDAFLMRR